MAWIGRGLKHHPVPSPLAMGRATFHEIRLLKATSSLSYSAFRVETSTASLGKFPHQPQSKEFFSSIQSKLTLFQSEALASSHLLPKDLATKQKMCCVVLLSLCLQSLFLTAVNLGSSRFSSMWSWSHVHKTYCVILHTGMCLI